MAEIDYPNLEYVAEIESGGGKNPASRVPNVAGALGTYQITPIAWKDLQQVYPEKYGRIDFKTGAGSERISAMATQDLFNIAAQRLLTLGLPVTEDNLLAVYNAGVGTVYKAGGNISSFPLETQNYIKKYRALKVNGSRTNAIRN